MLPLAGDYSAYPLRMLTDLPRTGHIFRSIANRPLPPDMVQDPFLGLDLGTGSGILLAAAWLQAKRNGVKETRLYGLELDAELSGRTDVLLRSLGIGQAAAADAHKRMIVDSCAADIVYTPYFSGVPGSYLRPSIAAQGLDPDALPARDKGAMDFGAAGAKVWRDIWSAGQGCGGAADCLGYARRDVCRWWRRTELGTGHLV